MKYQSSSTHCSKVMSNVKVFLKMGQLQGQGHSVKNNGTNGKVFIGNIYVKYQSSGTPVQKLFKASLRF